MRVALAALALALVAALTVPGTVAGAGSIADADAEVAALREEADKVLKAYLDALTTASALEVQIAEIEARLPDLAERRRELREVARERAVEAYKRSGVEVGAIIGATDLLSAMRRSHWLDQLNARDHATFDELAAVTEKLEAQRTQLQEARQAQQAALDELQARGRDMNAKLQAAEDRARAARAQPTRPVNPGGTGDAPPSAPIDYVPTNGAHPQHAHPALICIRRRESDRGDANHNGLHDAGYGAYNPAGPYLGAYQFLQSTWNGTANRAGRPELIGVPPNQASVYDQDDMAWSLFQRSGSGPWGGTCG
jgi:transposase-like protein